MKTIIRSIITGLLLLSTIILIGCENQSNRVLSNFLNQLILPNETETDLDLSNIYNYNGKVIQVTWESSHPNIIKETGEVTASSYDQNVLLIAVAKLEGDEQRKTFTVKVLADHTMELLVRASNSLILPLDLDSSISLPTTKVLDGKTISIEWVSSNEALLSSTGDVTLANEVTEVELTAYLRLNGMEVIKKFLVRIAQDPDQSPSSQYHLSNVYEGNIAGEIKPGTLYQFNGAVYRKAVSSRDYWLGIEVIVTLPEFIPDETRTTTSPYDPTAMRYLDNASVYLGGNSYSESDVGLSWMIGASPYGDYVDYQQSVAYRPFWRWIDGGNHFANANWRNTCFYYYPGDKIRMSVYATRPDFLQLRIELLEETTIPKYVARRASYNLGDNYPKIFISPEFPSRGHGSSKAEFKRVCAIDQVGNEGHPAQQTNAKSLNTIFHEVYLYRKINNVIYKVPMTQTRFAYCNAPSNFVGAVQVSYTGVSQSLGGEVVTLDPDNNH